MTFVLLTTGGTIAGKMPASSSREASAPVQYESGAVSGQALMKNLGLKEQTHQWLVREVYSIGSQNLRFDKLVSLRESLIECLKDPSIRGVLVTHGTDTMEETLYFMWLTLKENLLSKPIVFTGSMLPSDHPSSDGGKNLRDSMHWVEKLSANGLAQALGLCMDGVWLPALHVHKAHTTRVDTFSHSPFGRTLTEETIREMLTQASAGNSLKDHFSAGWQSIQELSVESTGFKAPSSAGSVEDPKDGWVRGSLSDPLDAWHLAESKVDSVNSQGLQLVWCHPFMEVPCWLRDYDSAVAKTVIAACFGNGNLPEFILAPLEAALKQGLRLIKTSRCESGGVYSESEPDQLNPYLKTQDPLRVLFQKNANLGRSKPGSLAEAKEPHDIVTASDFKSESVIEPDFDINPTSGYMLLGEGLSLPQLMLRESLLLHFRQQT